MLCTSVSLIRCSTFALPTAEGWRWVEISVDPYKVTPCGPSLSEHSSCCHRKMGWLTSSNFPAPKDCWSFMLFLAALSSSRSDYVTSSLHSLCCLSTFVDFAAVKHILWYTSYLMTIIKLYEAWFIPYSMIYHVWGMILVYDTYDACEVYEAS